MSSFLDVSVWSSTGNAGVGVVGLDLRRTVVVLPFVDVGETAVIRSRCISQRIDKFGGSHEGKVKSHPVTSATVARVRIDDERGGPLPSPIQIYKQSRVSTATTTTTVTTTTVTTTTVTTTAPPHPHPHPPPIHPPHSLVLLHILLLLLRFLLFILLHPCFLLHLLHILLSSSSSTSAFSNSSPPPPSPLSPPPPPPSALPTPPPQEEEQEEHSDLLASWPCGRRSGRWISTIAYMSVLVMAAVVVVVVTVVVTVDIHDCLYVCIGDGGGPARSSSIWSRATVAEVTGWRFTFPSWDPSNLSIRWETHRKRITVVSPMSTNGNATTVRFKSNPTTPTPALPILLQMETSRNEDKILRSNC